MAMMEGEGSNRVWCGARARRARPGMREALGPHRGRGCGERAGGGGGPVLCCCVSWVSTPRAAPPTCTTPVAPQVYVVAQRMSQRCTVEQYAVALAQHFVRTYPLVGVQPPLSLPPLMVDDAAAAGAWWTHGY